MLKIELDAYNASVLRHIGTALVNIAEDRENELGREVKGCTLGTPVAIWDQNVPPAGEGVAHILSPALPPPNTVMGQVAKHVEAPPAVTPSSPELTVPPAPPVSVSGFNEDDGFPDPPAPKNTVPAPPAANVAPPPSPTLDSAGIPWDARIHAAAKTKCKDGTWRNKPGVDPALLASVTAELKAVQAIPTPPAAPIVATTGPTTFAELMEELTPLLVPGGKLTAQQVNEACQVHGLPNCGALAARPDLIPTVWSQLCLILG